MNELIVTVENVNGILVTTSNRVAEELGVEHRSLLRKIDDYVEKFGSTTLCSEFYIGSTFENRGKQYRNYLITKKGIAQLIGGYSAAVPKAFDLNVAYINRFEEMEHLLQNQFKVPTSFKEALLLAVEQQEKIEKLSLENETQKQIIGELKPAKEYLDTILSSEDTMTITQIAADYSLSARAMNSLLHEQGLIRNVGGQWILYKEHMNKGYTKSETIQVKRKDGTDKIVMNTKWTQKGRLKIHEILTNLGIKANQDKGKVA